MNTASQHARLLFGSVVLLLAVGNASAFMPCVDGYPGFGTAEEEEQWYQEHLAACLDRIMAYPKPRGFMGPMSKGEAANRAAGCEEIADWWASRSDEWLYSFLPVETPHVLCVGYSSGCPIHGGYRGTLQPDLTRKYHYVCARGEEDWYPGCTARNPATGEEVTVVDEGEGWVVPEGFHGAGQTYDFIRAWPAGLIKKWVVGAPYAGEANRLDPAGSPAVQSLSYMYARTGDPKYAHAQGILLNRFAEVYPGYYQPAYGSRWRSPRKMCPANFEPDHIFQIAIAYDLVFDGLLQDASLVEFFATKGDADYNGDGTLTPEDITFNIQKSLMGSMYELMHRFPTVGQGADSALCAIARACGNPLIVQDALELLLFKVENEFHRDGMYFEDSSGYRGTGGGYVWAARALQGFFDGEIIKQPIDILGDPNFKLNRYQRCQTVRSCDGRLLAIGDSVNSRDPVLPTAPADGTLTASVLFDGPGFAILRSGDDVATRKHLLLYFAQSGCGHGHQDLLHVQPVAYGYDLSAQIGYWASGGQKHDALNRNTVNHCTVEVDKTGQRVMSVGTLDMYGITGPVKVCEATGNKVYEQTTLYRRMAALIDVGPDEHFIADIFRVAGGTTHDYLFHSLGGDDAANFGIQLEDGVEWVVQEGGSLLGPDAPYMSEQGHSYSYVRAVEQPGRYSGYSWLTDVRHADIDGGFVASWIADATQQIGLRLHMTGAPGRRLFTCKGEGFGVVGESPWDPYTVTRDEAEANEHASIFAAAIEPHRGETFISSVRRLDMQPPTGSRPGLEPVAMVVETAHNKTFYILHNPDRDTRRTLDADGHRFTLTGQFATVCFTRGELGYAVLANGTGLVVDGHALEAPGVATGTILRLDLENNSVEVEADGLVTTALPEQAKVTFHNPLYSRGETFPLVGVEHLGGNRYRLNLGDETCLYIGCGKVSSVDGKQNTMLTRVPQSKLFNGRHLYDGKHLRLSKSNDAQPFHPIRTVEDRFTFGSEDTSGVTFFLDEPGAAAQMSGGDPFWVYAIAPGDTFEIGNVALMP